MSRSYEIRLTTPGFDKAVAGLNQVAATSRRIDGLFQKLVSSATGLEGVTRRVNKLADALERAAQASGAVASAAGGGTRVSTGGGGGARKSRQFASGPNQQLAEAMQQLEAAKVANNPLAVRDAARSIRLKERAIALDDRRKGDPDHLTRPGLLELFSDLNNLMRNFRSGNLGAGAHTLASLMGRNEGGGINMQQLLGQGGLIGAQNRTAVQAAGGARLMALAANPITIAAGAAAVQIMAMAAASRMAASALTAIGSPSAAAGASPGEVAALRALGVSPGAVPGLGASLRAKLSSDPFAMAAGGYALPSHLTGESDAKLIRAQLDRLRGLQEEGRTLEMVRQARVLSMEAYLDELQASKLIWEQMKATAKTSDRVFDHGKTQAARDYEAALKDVGTQFELVKAQIGALPMGGLTLHLVALSKWMNAFNQAQAQTPDWVKVLGAFFTGGGIAGGLSAMGAISKQSNPQQAATNRNTKALEDLAAAIRDITGGGVRARGAFSPASHAAAAIKAGDSLNAARNLRAFRL